MPRSRSFRLSTMPPVLRRMAVVLGVLALLAQVLVPLSRPQVAWVDQGLFPPTCSVHGGDLAGDLAELGQCDQCPLCQGQGLDRVVVMAERSVSAAFAAIPAFTPVPPTRQHLPSGTAARPPLPSRGPPALA